MLIINGLDILPYICIVIVEATTPKHKTNTIMDRIIYDAFMTDGKMNKLINALVDEVSHIETTTDDWMKNDDEYTGDMVFVKLLIAHMVDCINQRMGIDDCLQIGFPIACSILNQAMREKGLIGEFYMSGENVLTPWVSFRKDTSNDEYGIECSFFTMEEWEKYLNLFERILGDSRNELVDHS